MPRPHPSPQQQIIDSIRDTPVVSDWYGTGPQRPYGTGRSRAQFEEPRSINDISDFFAEFRTNESHAQPNQYEVLISPPMKPAPGPQNPSKRFISQVLGDARAIQLRCESVTLPGRNLSSTPDTNIHGPLREVVNNVNYDDSVAMVFQASADLRERVFFEKWQYTAFNPNTWNVGYYDDYIGRVDIYLLDRHNQRKYGLRLEECFPKSIGPTELSYATTNEIIMLPITMNFRYWTTLDITQKTNAVEVPMVPAGAWAGGGSFGGSGATGGWPGGAPSGAWYDHGSGPFGIGQDDPGVGGS